MDEAVVKIASTKDRDSSPSTEMGSISRIEPIVIKIIYPKIRVWAVVNLPPIYSVIFLLNIEDYL